MEFRLGPIRLREDNILPMWVTPSELMARNAPAMAEYNEQVLGALRERLPSKSRLFMEDEQDVWAHRW